MGCKASKNLNSQPPIEYNFPPTTRPELDTFFESASDPLRKIESLRQKIYSTKKKGVEIAGTANSLESPYTKAVEVLFWALSAAKKGKISDARVSLTEQQPPFGSLNTLDYCKDTLDLFKTLQEYLTILSETTETLQTLVSQIQKLKDEQIEIKKSIDPSTVTQKTSKVIDTNMKKLTESISTSAKVLSQVPDEQQNALELIRYVQGFMETVDQIGAKADAVGLIRPGDIYRWIEAEKKKNEKGQSKYVAPDSSNRNTARTDEMGNPGQKTASDLGNGEEKPNGNQLIQAESVPIGQASNKKSQENLKQDSNYQSNHKNNLNANFVSDPHNESPSFGEINPNSNQANGKGNSKQGNYAQLNDSATIYNHMQPKSNENLEEEKKVIFLGNENAVVNPKTDDIGKVDGPGYLSPGGSKQAGILQGEENILDAEEKRHPLAQESTSILGFAEKARAYLDSKN